MQRRILILFSTLFFFLNISAQEKYRAVHWGVLDGLSQSVVYDIIKGENGFIWIGTFNGLNRFDGNNFKKYFADKTKKNKAIAGNNINGLIEDSLNNIWIGTDKGLSRYDNEADSFTNLYSSPAKTIIPFWATKDEVFCWDYQDYPGSRLIAYNIHSFAKRTLVKISPADSVGWGISDHYPIFDAGSNSIWMEQGLGGSPGGGLLQVSLSTGKKVKFGWPCYRNISNDDHSFEGMRYDRRRNAIWISNPDGLVEFTLNDKQFHRINAMDFLVKQKDFHQWAGITIDTLGRVWMGTIPKGIIIYDPANNSVNLAFPKDSVLQQNVSDANVLLYADRDGITWTGSWSSKGIYQVIPFPQSVVRYTHDLKGPNSLLSDLVIQCFDAGQGKIWMGTPYGLNIFDPATGLFQMLQRKDLPGLKGKNTDVLIAAIDTTVQKAWVDADGLIYQMDMTTKKCIPVIVKGDANLKILPSGFPTPYKNTCILTWQDNERQDIFIVNNDSAIAEMVLSFPAGTIDFFKTATDDRLLFLRQPDSTVNLTYALLNKKWIRTPNPMDSIHWIKLIYNKTDQTYWLTADKTLYHYNKKFQQIRAYTQPDGMPDFDVCGIIPDNQNNIWFNTESSIHLLNIKTGRITMLSEKDGFQKQGFTPVLNFGKSASGELYLPGGVLGQGFNRINPSRYSQTSSFVYLQSVLINQKAFLLPKGTTGTQELFLKHFENKITIETGIIDFYSKGINHIRYKIGENTNWQYQTGSTIHYEGLSSGNHKLIIQASNASNEFNGPEKILVIHISPPFWQTWWFRILVAAFIITIIYAFVQYRSRNLRQRNVALEEKVLQRTKELKHSLENLRETQTQLIQREKMASLGELTAGIAHEIQNPLNFVNNFSDINKELIAEMKEEIEKGNYDEVRIVAKIVGDNEEKISHHGKRAGAIVKGMLEHSRSSTGVKETTDINALAAEYLRLAFHGLQAKDKSFNATMKTDFDENIGKINIIPHDIGRVILNLVTNAFYAVTEKSKQQGGDNYEPTVTVSTKKINSKVEIKVKDNGNGIPQKILDKIFQPFFTTKPTGEGTGLGLSLSYDIITKAHNGELRVETKEGEYAEFIVSLPA